MKKDKEFLKCIEEDNGDTRIIAITPSDILDEMDFSEIQEYLNERDIGFYSLYDKKEVSDIAYTLASFIQESINADERIAFNVVLALDETTRKLLKKELNDFNKGTARGV